MAKTSQSSNTATAKGRMFPTRNGLEESVRTQMIELLNARLADTLDLYSQTKQAHWNVKGEEFYQLHKMFDEHAECASEWADLIAERAVMLGGYATGTVRMSATDSQLEEFPTDITDSLDYVKAVADRWGVYANSVREGIDVADQAGDADTADLLTEISRQADMNLWFQEAHIQGK